MNKRVAAYLFVGASLLMFLSGSQRGTTSKEPWNSISTGTVGLDRVLSGAPPAETRGGSRYGPGLMTYTRVDLTPYKSISDTLAATAGLYIWPMPGWIMTNGFSVNDSGGSNLTLWSASAAPTISFSGATKDSGMAVLTSMPILPGHSAGTQSWFYIRLSRVPLKVGDLMLGIGDGFRAVAAPGYGAPWEPTTWDGTINDSHNGSLYFNLVGTGGIDDLDTLRLIAEGPSASDLDTTKIVLSTPVVGTSGAYFELAFHAFGLDSVQYYAAGETGTMTFTNAWQTQPGDTTASVMIADRNFIAGAIGGGAILISEAWAASAPY